MRKQSVGLAALVLACASNAWCSAFAVNELGTRAQGMGGAFTAVASDATAIFFNPAGIAFQRGMSIELNNLIVNGQFRFIPSEAPPGTVVPAKGFPGAVSQPFIPIASFYWTRRMSEKWAVGFGGFTPNGLAANWTNFNDGDPANTKYTGRYAGTRAALQQYWFQPTVAYRLSESQAISVGVAFVHTHLFLEQSFLNPNDAPTDFSRNLAKDIFPGVDPDLAYRSFARLLPEGRLRAAATANKPGLTAGYLFKSKSGFNLGLSYRTHVVSHLKGNAAFAFTNTGALLPFLPKDRGLDVLFPNQGITGTFTTPGAYTIGVAHTKMFGGTIAVDFKVQDFRRFQELPINFEKTADAKGREIGTSNERRLTFNFKNSYVLNAGFERPVKSAPGPKMMKSMFKNVTLRGGYIYDRSPVPEKSVGPLFPDTDRHSGTFGMTKSLKSIDLTMFYQFMQFINKTTNVPANRFQGTNGEYRNFANLFGLGLTWRMGTDGKLDR